MTAPPIPVATAILMHGNRVLLGKRKGTPSAGTWSTPGGKADQPGTLRSNLCREVREETGLLVWPAELHQVAFGDEHISANGQSYPMSYFSHRYLTPKPPAVRLREPDKCEEWRWVDYLGLVRLRMFEPERIAILLAFGL